MNKITRLIVADSYEKGFEILKDELKGKTASLKSKNFVFCEEKVSLMAERIIASAYFGSFNTEVVSFGKFLKKRLKREIKTLSKEGSAMVINGLLPSLDLKVLRQNGVGFSSCLFELISQLKSAKVNAKDLEEASVTGTLKGKTNDIAKVFSAYERFVEDNGYFDQSSLLKLLPQIIDNDKEIKNADVFIAGYTSFTMQMRDVIFSLLKNAKSVTAILTGGRNERLFVNETERFYFETAKKAGCDVIRSVVESAPCKESEIIKNDIFSLKLTESVYQTDKICSLQSENVKEETLTVASMIKAKVIKDGARYSDFTVALSDVDLYTPFITSAFKEFGIPFFIDGKKDALYHPLVSFITSYLDIHIKNCDKDCVLNLVFNPLFTEDENTADAFSQYVIKYNVNYDKFKKPFTYGKDLENFADIENKRQDVVKLLSFPLNIKKALSVIYAKEKTEKLQERLQKLNETEEQAINAQIYDKIIQVLDEMEALSFTEKFSPSEIKKLFLSAVFSMKLSIIPQYADAVFIGGYKEAALYSNDYLFSLGLDSSVPKIKEDVALLSDGDIVRLEKEGVFVEPKISIVNRRNAEKTGLSLSAFKKKLFLSCPFTAIDGSKNERSEVYDFFEKRFTVRPVRYKNEFLTEKSGLYAFARSCRDFAENKTQDIDDATCYYFATDKNEKVKSVMRELNAELQTKLSVCTDVIINNVKSPTAIERFFACPYKSFLSKALSAQEEDTGNMENNNVGNIIHAFLAAVMTAKKNGKITDEKSFLSVFDGIKRRMGEAEENKKFTETPSGKAKYERVVKEAEKFCRVAIERLNDTEFSPLEIEAEIGGEKYPLSLSGGKYKLHGKVDRVDALGDNIRITDYKTGTSYEAADLRRGLFSGEKIQTYLYAKAFVGKTPVDISYEYINDRYVSNVKKSAAKRFMNFEKEYSEEDVKVVKNRIDYAVAVSEKALSEMQDGVVIPSHLSGECENCPFKGACDEKFRISRTIGVVTEETIECALKGKEQDG